MPGGAPPPAMGEGTLIPILQGGTPWAAPGVRLDCHHRRLGPILDWRPRPLLPPCLCLLWAAGAATLAQSGSPVSVSISTPGLTCMYNLLLSGRPVMASRPSLHVISSYIKIGFSKLRKLPLFLVC